MLKEALSDFFTQHPALENETDYAVAVSGGPDSMALASALINFYPDKKFHILTVDHGLRTESADEALQVNAAFSKALNAVSHVLKWEGDKPESAVMEAARKARYDLMQVYCVAHKIKTLFIAHHRADQAETFLIRLAKGSGLDGLTAMVSLSQQNEIYLARPFLNLEKIDLITYCQDQKIDYIDDPSNDNEKYLRPRLRRAKEILEAEGLSDKRLAVTANRLRRAREALTHYTHAVMDDVILSRDEGAVLLDFTKFKTAPDEIALRVLQNLIESYREGYDYGVRMEKLESLCENLLIDPQHFKPRTLGGLRFSLRDKHTMLLIEKELK